MEIRDAKVTDAQAICSLINEYAELDKMLARSLADIYENLQSFKVAQKDSGVLGCCALQIVWSDLAEIKSLVIEKNSMGRGIGSAIVQAEIEKASQLGIQKVFTLTLEPEFFEKLGFKKVDKDTLPMKVWSECVRCAKQDNCDEIAMILEL